MMMKIEILTVNEESDVLSESENNDDENQE